jgi:hypothetical protein
MTRAVAIVAGLVLIAIAFFAATDVADTREGLMAEIVTLLAGLAGVGVLLYGLVPKRPHSPAAPAKPSPAAAATGARSANDLVVGGGGLVLAVILVGGLLFSGGWQWALVGAVLLLPMIAGCVYLLSLFARAREREWRIDIRRLASFR